MRTTVIGGLDFWALDPQKPLPPEVGRDLVLGSALEDHLRLGLPDADNQWQHRPVSPWLRVSSQLRLNANWEASIQWRADQLMGAHVDVARLDWAPSPFMGVRTGVVNFNTNWCRTYDVDSPWIAEPDVFCRANDYMRMNNSAPGVQVYTNTGLGNYQVQAIAGLYRPRWLSYDTDEFGFNTAKLRSNFKFESNRKQSLALNILHLETGTQTRLGILRSEQSGRYIPKLQADDRDRDNFVKNQYAAIDAYVRPKIRLKYTRSVYTSRNFYSGLMINPEKNKSETVEWVYEPSATDLLAVGWSRFVIAAAIQDPLNPQTGQAVLQGDYYYSKQTSWMASWRHQWGKGMHSSLQWTHAQQVNGYEGRRRPRSGDALGLRVAYQY